MVPVVVVLSGAAPVAARPEVVRPQHVPAARLVDELRRETLGWLTVGRDPVSQRVRRLAGSATHPLTPASNASATAISRSFINRYAEAFGVSDPAGELVEIAHEQGIDGTSVIKYQQQINGVPVLAGEIAVQLDDQGSILGATGESLTSAPGIVDTTPSVDPGVALVTALQLTSKYDQVEVSELQPGPPALLVYDPILIGADDASSPHLVWQIEVRTAIGDIQRLVLIDAHTGGVTFQVSMVSSAKLRIVCDNGNNNPGASEECTLPVRVEGGPDTGIADVDNAYRNAGVTYDYFRTVLGRDSVDGQGMPLISTVGFCDTTCPYNNAFWSGEQMVYGAGYPVADDVVAHELTHGVTDFSARLFYYAESGAISESMSDVFGELIDQINVTSGDLVGDKWKIGEQLREFGSSPIRDMQDPTAFGDPDRMRSPLFSGSSSDGHGVHQNSGVGNKAAFLITDGGSFNGQVITGLGINKTATIYYQALTTLLGPGSDYLDLFGALQQACTNLLGTIVVGGSAVTPTDCQQVTKAVTATEMNLAPTTPGARLTATDCSGASTRSTTLFSDDMESGMGQWTSVAVTGSAQWEMFQGSSQSGSTSLHGPNPNTTSDFNVRPVNSIVVPTGSTMLQFDHSFEFEATDLQGDNQGPIPFDGGVVEFSVNGPSGPWSSSAALPTVNGYNKSLFSGSGTTNPLRGRQAFGDTSPGYQTTRIDISSFAGATLLFRYRIGSDGFVGAEGWFVDDVAVYRCQPPGGENPPLLPPPPPPPSNLRAVDPVRLLDTRPGQSPAALIQVLKAQIFANSILDVQVSDLAGATPPLGVAAVSLNVTATNTASAGFLTVYPCGNRSAVSNVNYTAGDTVANAVITPVSSTGRICIFSSAPADVVVDLNGWFAAPPGFAPVGPARVLDTRPGESPTALRAGAVPKAKVGGTNVLQVQVADLAGLTPPSGVAAVSLNVTAIGASVPGFLTVYPCGVRPAVSNVNFGSAALNADVVANAVVAPVSTTGTICIFASTPIDVVVDINGWFVANAGFAAVGPARLADSRVRESPNALRVVPKVRISPTNIAVIDVGGLAGLTPAAGISAVSLNVTATNADVSGFVTVFPCGAIRSVSNVNFTAQETVANATISPVSSSGQICIFASTPTDVVVDINGWFGA